jgi:lipoprotein signal peptidase
MKKSTKKQVKVLRPTYHIVVFVSFLVALILDQVTKHIASFQGSVQINPGVSFGILSGPWLTVLLLIFFVAFFEWSCPRWHKLYPIASGFLLGGAMSNIVDRIVLNGVRDFLPIPFLHIQNNLADWFIVLSLAFILFKSAGKTPSVSQKRSAMR